MKRRILFYVQHLLGVGHVKRAAAIARAAAQHPHLDVHVALGGQPVSLADFGAATVHQLPWVRAEDVTFGTLLDADGKPIDLEWQTSRRSALMALAAQVDPHVLLVEHFPFGRGKFAFELVPLCELMRGKPRRRILCSVRDVLVEGDAGGKIDRTIGLLRQWFDGVLVHGDERIIPFEATFPAARSIADLLHYTGYVVENEGKLLPSAHKPHGEIVVSVGGGAVGEALLRTSIDAAKADDLGRRWRLLIGANLSEPEFQNLRLRSKGCDALTIERARSDFLGLLGGAALSISQAGYNTLMDILVTNCRAVVVPFAAGNESEQVFRAREFERRGLVSVLEEKDLTTEALLSAARRALAAPPPAPASGINFSGASNTAHFLAHGVDA